MILAATSPQDVFGTIKPPISSIPDEPLTAAGSFLSLGIYLFIVVAGITVLIFLLWGALDWIASSGDKEKLAKAQHKITNAVIGIIIVVAVLSISCLINVSVLGIAPDVGSCFNFIIPTL